MAKINLRGLMVEQRGIEILHRALPFQPAVIVEVGVNIGSLTEYLLRSRGDILVYGVDVWEQMESSEEYLATGDTLSKVSREQLIKNKEIAAGRIEKYGDRAKLLQCDSLQAATFFKDGTLAMVFVDADHSYKAVRADILAWLPKVRRGGYIGGHDYGVAGYGVKQAVDELEDAGILAPVERGSNTTWFSRG